MAEPATQSLTKLVNDDSDIVAWWSSKVECVSALTRRRLEGTLDSDAAQTAFRELERLSAGWDEIEPGESLRETAIRFLRVHPLRAADALQLAAAFVAADGRPSSLELVTLDDRLAEAARKEGFVVVDVAMA
ncbi:MAG: PIN domain-containing protein [Alphaproteobacteria bacterium]|nr:PIN domain-containing protein [Alphaproteobacteria bacterium]